MRKCLAFLFLLLASQGLFAHVWFNALEYYTTLNYNELTGISLRQKIFVGHYGEEEDFFITLSGGRSNDPLNRRLTNRDGYGASYQLVNNLSDKIILKDLGTLSNDNEVLIGHLKAGSSTENLEYYLIMDPDIFLPYGYLTDSFELNLYIGDLENYELAKTVTLQVALNSSREASLSVVPEGGSFNESRTHLTMDYGWLTARAERTADILVRANLPYTLSLTSRNEGELKLNKSNRWNSTATVPYTCYVNDSIVDLNRPYVEIASADISDKNGDRYSLRFIIGDFWDIPSGTYKDTIQITLSAW